MFMKKIAGIVAWCVIFITVITCIGFSSPVAAMRLASGSSNPLPAGPNDAQPGEKIELTCQYPVLSSYAGLNYAYTVNILYTGTGSKIFDLKATVPDGFNYTITPGYGEGGQIAAIRLDGTKNYPDSIKLTVTPFAWKSPAPGRYPIKLLVSAGDLQTTIDLTAIVTAKYDMKMSTPDGRLNTEATAGQDNNFTITLENSGSGDLEKLEVTCLAKDRPNGWSVTCNPSKIDSLKIGEVKEIQVDVKPSDKTIAGDYQIAIQAEPEARYAFANLQIRVTVLTPTIWGWVGVGIVILVVAALAVIFIRFGRR
jgi:uncharacterized membrane protein